MCSTAQSPLTLEIHSKLQYRSENMNDFAKEESTTDPSSPVVHPEKASASDLPTVGGSFSNQMGERISIIVTLFLATDFDKDEDESTCLQNKEAYIPMSSGFRGEARQFLEATKAAVKDLLPEENNKRKNLNTECKMDMKQIHHPVFERETCKEEKECANQGMRDISMSKDFKPNDTGNKDKRRTRKLKEMKRYLIALSRKLCRFYSIGQHSLESGSVHGSEAAWSGVPRDHPERPGPAGYPQDLSILPPSWRHPCNPYLVPSSCIYYAFFRQLQKMEVKRVMKVPVGGIVDSSQLSKPQNTSLPNLDGVLFGVDGLLLLVFDIDRNGIERAQTFLQQSRQSKYYEIWDKPNTKRIRVIHNCSPAARHNNNERRNIMGPQVPD
ncbi:hypothetical protein SUGI_1080270 [Cryptomeria japonica]|nr:hypothetical protein SUGI_1080270 [Cryptomeria japonica]